MLYFEAFEEIFATHCLLDDLHKNCFYFICSPSSKFICVLYRTYCGITTRLFQQEKTRPKSIYYIKNADDTTE